MLGLFNRAIRRLIGFLNEVVARQAEEELQGTLADEDAPEEVVMEPVEGLDDELVSGGDL